uniref:Uncharacterized protein n=1 Tax=Rhizophora mucronata TaxID=61149 RepID=A0A2P2JZK0_RHIMU
MLLFKFWVNSKFTFPAFQALKKNFLLQKFSRFFSGGKQWNREREKGCRIR